MQNPLDFSPFGLDAAAAQNALAVGGDILPHALDRESARQPRRPARMQPKITARRVFAKIVRFDENLASNRQFAFARRRVLRIFGHLRGERFILVHIFDDDFERAQNRHPPLGDAVEFLAREKLQMRKINLARRFRRAQTQTKPPQSPRRIAAPPQSAQSRQARIVPTGDEAPPSTKRAKTRLLKTE